MDRVRAFALWPVDRSSPSPTRRLARILAVVTILHCSVATPPAFAAGATPPQPAGSVLPAVPEPYRGRLGPTVARSDPPRFPPAVVAPKGAPNILLIMTDDTGFGAASTFGGPVPTPALDRLAGRGLRYNNFHTSGVCSPTRAALLTGRNAHAVGNGLNPEVAIGYPGYTQSLPKSAATVAEVLRQNGYSTAMFGKHHNTPRAEISPAGPFDRWPTGLGFDYFYGFMGGDSDQYRPVLYRNTVLARVAYSPEYRLDKDLADDAIAWIHNQKGAAPDRPFMIYYAPGTMHAPQQAPADWIARFRGRFDRGWDAVRQDSVDRQKTAGIVPRDAAITPRPAEILAWSSLTPDQQRLHARMMEVAAATLAYQDHQIGRLLDELDRMGERDDTLILFIEGDNGAAAEAGLQGTTNQMGRAGNAVPESEAYMLSVLDELGGPRHYNSYSAGWAWAMDAPFPYWKLVSSHMGGMQNGMVVSWPRGIAAHGEMRRQFHHVVDILPTILDVAGLPAPASVNGVRQQPLNGVSLAYSFAPGGATLPGRHHVQYFEVLGHRGIYRDGWFANTTPGGFGWAANPREPAGDAAKWELYDLRTDFAQARDLAARYPGKLAEMKALWWREAAANNVLPVMETVTPDRWQAASEITAADRPHTTFWGPASLHDAAAPSLDSKSFTIDVDLDRRPGAKGVLLAVGNGFGGWSFYCTESEIVAYEAFSQQPDHRYRIAAPFTATGDHKVRFDFDYERVDGRPGAGTMRISIDGKVAATGRVQRTSILPQSNEQFGIGEDSGGLVSPDYGDDNRFTGTIRRVDITFP